MSLYMALVPLILLMGTLVYYPALKTFWQSFHDFDVLLPDDRSFSGLQNYLEALTKTNFFQTLLRSLIIVVIALPLELLIGLSAALLLHSDFRGRNLVRTLALIPWFLPPIVVGFMWSWILNGQYGARNGLLYQMHLISDYHFWLQSPNAQLIWVAVVHVWTRYPFALIVLLAGLQGVPHEVYEAAKVDGAKDWRLLVHIVLPLLRPSLAIVLVVEFISAFQIFDIIWSLTAGSTGGAINPYTKTLMILNYEVVFKNLNLGVGSALSYIILALSLVIGLNMVKQMNRGGE
ncbi:MAG: carbohydrate ABC transporter permease [Deinococcus sp.]